MSDGAELLGMFLHLAWVSEHRGRPFATDRLLVLAGALATELGLPSVADSCRHRVLNHNRQHLLRKSASMADALRSSDFAILIQQLRRRYPQERVEQMMADLGIIVGNERQTYDSDEEYALALLDRVRRAS